MGEEKGPNRILQRATFVAFLVCSAVAVAEPLEVGKPEDVGMSSDRLENVRQHFEDLLDAQKSGGFQLLVSRHGKVVMYENLGWADVENEVPVSDETLFRIYSMTKPIVGVAMMMLYEEGRFSLGDPIADHIPELADLMVYAGDGEDGTMLLEEPKRSPTIHDLLQHSAGFTYGAFSDTPVDTMYRDKQLLSYDQTLQQFIEKLATVPLLFQPGDRWHYSVAVDVQGYLIEKWSGKPLETFLRERLFEPLGMDQTVAWVPEDRAELLANIYTHDDEGTRQKFEGALATNHYRAPGGFSGGGQLVSTSDDYWRFCQMLLNGGEFEGRRYLSPRTVELMTTDRLAAPADFGGPGRGFGLNFGVVTDASQGSFPVGDGEFWWGGLATTVFWIDPEEEMVAIMLTQYLPWAGPEYEDLYHRLVRSAIVD